jgi:hypothetical protein
MPNDLVNLCLLLAYLATTQPAHEGPSLMVGDPAPSIAVSTWVEGEPVRSFQRGRVYVLAFGSAWSDPCRVAIKQLAVLRKAHEDVVFMGVDIWEDDLSLVPRFLEEFCEAMGGCVALDTVDTDASPGEGTMARTWMKAAGQDGIPTAFVVEKDGRIAWIGHPAGLERVIDSIAAGEYDVAAAAVAWRAEVKRRARIQLLIAKLEQTGGPREAVEEGLLVEVESLMSDDAELARRLVDLRFILLLASDEPAAAAYAEQLASHESHRNDPAALNSLAWSLIDPRTRPAPGDAARKAALRIARQAVALSGERPMNPLDTMALAEFLNGDARAAAATQERALRLARDEAQRSGTDVDPELEKHLAQYRAPIEPRERSNAP